MAFFFFLLCFSRFGCASTMSDGTFVNEEELVERKGPDFLQSYGPFTIETGPTANSFYEVLFLVHTDLTRLAEVGEPFQPLRTSKIGHLIERRRR